MLKALVFSWKTYMPGKQENEDAHSAEPRQGVFVVADGVTRSLNEQGAYPYPSPARQAAQVVADQIGRSLVLLRENGALVTEKDMRAAFRAANEAVEQLNRELGFWEDYNYLDRDLAGAVGAAAVIQEDSLSAVWAYLGDCTVIHLRQNGMINWQTDDDVAAARRAFPSARSMSANERTIRIRREHRNRPEASHPTYGVLTGERAALAYVTTGHIMYTPGDVLAVYSDGLAPFIRQGAEFRSLLLHGRAEEIRAYVTEHAATLQYPDDKTLILIRTLPPQ